MLCSMIKVLHWRLIGLMVQLCRAIAKEQSAFRDLVALAPIQNEHLSELIRRILKFLMENRGIVVGRDRIAYVILNILYCNIFWNIIIFQ